MQVRSSSSVASVMLLFPVYPTFIKVKQRGLRDQITWQFLFRDLEFPLASPHPRSPIIMLLTSTSVSQYGTGSVEGCAGRKMHLVCTFSFICIPGINETSNKQCDIGRYLDRCSQVAMVKHPIPSLGKGWNFCAVLKPASRSVLDRMGCEPHLPQICSWHFSGWNVLCQLGGLSCWFTLPL